MRKRLLCLCLVGAIFLTGTVYAAEETSNEVPVPVVELAAEAVVAAPVEYAVGFTVDGNPVSTDMMVRVYNQVTYVSLHALARVLNPDAAIYWSEGQARVYCPDTLIISAQPDSRYILANDRYLYVPEGVLVEDGQALLPVRIAAKAMGAGVIWSAENGTNVVSGSGAIEPGSQFYDAESLYWMSRIIFAESGNQPLEGKIAVGNVILNRVRDPRFPNTVKDVIFDRSGGVYQFTPAGSGSINRTPNSESVIAAKLVLDGAVVLGTSLYFNSTSSSSWAARNRSYVATIGGHNFYQ